MTVTGWGGGEEQALAYYQGGDMYLFDEFQTSRPAFSRRPSINNLYDVFRWVCGRIYPSLSLFFTLFVRSTIAENGRMGEWEKLNETGLFLPFVR